MGESEKLGESKVRMYCSTCMECYVPKSRYCDVDGAAFGPNLPIMFLMSYPSFVPTNLPKYFDPKIFGFRVHNKKSAVLRRLEELQIERKPVVIDRQQDSDSF